MRIQTRDAYTLDVNVTWLDPEQIQLVILRWDQATGHTSQEYYLTPQELMNIADYIDDRMCR